eukprot:763112-Hanusia_phi.AAC.2
MSVGLFDCSSSSSSSSSPPPLLRPHSFSLSFPLLLSFLFLLSRFSSPFRLLLNLLILVLIRSSSSPFSTSALLAQAFVSSTERDVDIKPRTVAPGPAYYNPVSERRGRGRRAGTDTGVDGREKTGGFDTLRMTRLHVECDEQEVVSLQLKSSMGMKIQDDGKK